MKKVFDYIKGKLNILWRSINGNKSIFCTFVFGALQQDMVINYITTHWSVSLLSFLQWFFGVGGIISLWLHFAPNKLGGKNALSPSKDIT